MSHPIQSVAVFGAGITGVTTAYALRKRGFDVTVFDKNRYAAMETSFANGGQLSASNAEVWTRWSTIFKGIKWMFEPGAPLLVNPKPSWHKYSWMAQFMGSIPNYKSNTVKTVRMAMEARAHLKSWATDEGFDFDCEDKGILHIYKDEKEFAHARKVNVLLAEGGLERNEISGEEARRIEPAIQTDLVGGFYTPSDFSGDIHSYCRSLSKACFNFRHHAWHHRTQTGPWHCVLGGNVREIGLAPFDQRHDPVIANVFVVAIEFGCASDAETFGTKTA
jgi:D-amino-acid dehydrogenase